MTRPTRAMNTATQEATDIFYQRTDTENGRMFVQMPESQAIDMGMTVIETVTKNVVVGVTGSEYLITEPRTFAFVEITNDDRFEVINE